jgi:hypothetical protein
MIMMAVTVLGLVLTPLSAAQEDWDLPDGGHFFTQVGGLPGRGYAITDEGNVRFWSEFKRLGGVAALGYPISPRFEWGGFTCQAMQRAVFQWHPETNSVAFVNVFDYVNQAGKDEWLKVVRQTPPQFDTKADAGLTWDQVAKKRLALLDANPAIKQQYYAVVGDPIVMNGLPMSPITDMGNNYALRCQRIVIQQWKENVPWAAQGQVTVALGGSIAKEMGLLPQEAMAAPASPPLPGIVTQSTSGTITDGVGQATLAYKGTIAGNGDSNTEEILLDAAGPLEISVALQPHTAGANYPLDFETVLTGPDGTSLPTPNGSIRKQALGLVNYRLPMAVRGVWRLTVRAKDVGSTGMDYRLTTTMPSTHSILFSTDKREYRRGETTTLIAIYRDDGASTAITDAEVVVNIAKNAGEAEQIKLEHNGNGVYRGTYTWDDQHLPSSALPGKIELTLNASGHDGSNTLIKRQAALTINLLPSP